MAPVLPHDLILVVLDLVVPPPTSKNRLARAELCKVLTLVHRSWTLPAQQKLLEALPVSMRGGRRSHEVLERRLAAAMGDGRRIRGMDLRLAPEWSSVVSFTEQLLALVRVGVEVKRLTLRDFDRFLFPPEAVPDLCAISWHGNQSTSTSISLVTLDILPHNLTFLSLWHVKLTAAPMPFPNVTTLILVKCALVKSPACYPFLASFPTLRSLVWDETWPVPSHTFFQHTPNTLRNLLVGIVSALHYGTEATGLVALPQRLKTLTFRCNAPPADEATLKRTMDRCEAQGTRFELILDELELFDQEAWALQVE
ncbi:hypothetical protein JCM10207_000035 [Rhodosporidiobolus poonsookiae]